MFQNVNISQQLAGKLVLSVSAGKSRVFQMLLGVVDADSEMESAPSFLFCASVQSPF